MTFLARIALTAVLPITVAGSCSPLGPEGSSEGSHHRSRRLILTGSSTVAPLAGEIARRFESRHPGLRVDVQTGGSARGIADARQGLADIGMVSRNLNPDESDLHAFGIARDGIGMIVHKSNPVESLTNEQIIAIYTGKLENWKAVGGADAPIIVVQKAEGRSTLELFLQYFQLRNTDVGPDVVIGDNEQGIKTVAGNPNAIGYVSIGTAQFDAEQGVAIKLLPVGGVAASLENVRKGSFPLSRTLNLVTRESPAGLVDEFIRFAQSPQVHDLVEDLSFVPIP